MTSQPVAANSWITDLFASIDRRDAEGFSGFLTEDARFSFGNQPPVEGRAAVRDAVGAFFDSIAGLEHRVERVWEYGESVVCHGEVSYQRLDGGRVTLPFADIFYMQDNLISDYRIYMDVTPLFADAG
ncbi:MAG: nuclear transport factor 2 family protein [Gammaproteobacteria bacterium]|nr:nuclear transport factor 2 family protein [Gammaproteobacteria bacterium]